MEENQFHYIFQCLNDYYILPRITAQRLLDRILTDHRINGEETAAGGRKEKSGENRS